MRNGRRVGQTGVGAAQCGGYVRVQSGEPFDMQFAHQTLRRVDSRAARCRCERCGHHRFQSQVRVVAGVLQQRRIGLVAEVDVLPGVFAQDLRRARIEQELVRIEALALRRVPGAMHAPAVDQVRCCAGQQRSPDTVYRCGHLQTLDFSVACGIKQTQVHGLRVRRGQCKSHAAIDYRCAQCRRAVQRPKHRVHHAGIKPGSSTKHDSGGKCKTSDCPCPCAHCASACRLWLPIPLPPYTAASVLMSSRHAPPCGTPSR